MQMSDEKQTLPYCVPVDVSSKTDNRSTVFRTAMLPAELVTGFLTESSQNCWDLFMRGCTQFPQRPCIGYRTRELGSNTLGTYKWMSYDDIRLAALQIGTALTQNGLCPPVEFPEERSRGGQRMRILGVFMTNCVEWFILEQACNAFGLTLVPLYDTLGEEALQFIMAQTKMKTVVVSQKTFSIMKSVLLNIECCTTVIVVPNHEGDQTFKTNLCPQWQSDTQQKILPWDDVIQLGRQDTIVTPSFVEPTTIQTICYTSGTTGLPKGVLLSHKAFVANISALIRGPFARSDLILDENHVHLSYLPLAHIFERDLCNLMWSIGSRIGCYSGDILKLMDDAQVLSPTIFVSVPRLFLRIDDKVRGSIASKSTLVRKLFNIALNSKLARLRENGVVEHALWDKLVFGKTRKLLGNRLQFLVSGGAALDTAVEERVQVFFSTPLLQGYGLTETLGAALITYPRDPVKGHVGAPIPWAEICFESVEEMSYSVHAEPISGEILIRGAALFDGYFLNAELTNEVLDSDGWFHTGDVGILLPNGGIKLIDRRKNIFKLSQGEYISPEKIENVYVQASLVSQIFVYGHSLANYLVAVIIPDRDMAERWFSTHVTAIDSSYEKLIQLPAFYKAIETEMESLAKSEKLKGFEKVKKFMTSHQTFSVENGLLTPTFKLKRYVATKQFQKELDAMY